MRGTRAQQEENAALRADARAIIEGQHAELAACEARACRLEEERGQMQALLRELRAGLEATLADAAAQRAAAAAGHEARAALAVCRRDPAAVHACKRIRPSSCPSHALAEIFR